MTAAGGGPRPTTSPLALTMGEPSGIGGEIALKAWLQRKEHALSAFFLIDDPARVAGIAKSLGLAVPVLEISEPAACSASFDRGLPVLPLDEKVQAFPGRPSPDNAKAVLKSIRQATALTLTGAAAAVVTNPIHKSVLMNAGFGHPGHTEFLAELCSSKKRPVMMLACAALRVVPVTVHQPLQEVPASLTTELIVETAQTTVEALRNRFGIADPRLVVAGLNPHAGEDGRLGREDSEIIKPAVEALAAEGVTISGPLAADSLFHPAARQCYDAAICMYHDQALIPIKTIDFERGVNVTLGLPIVRTSPDHGTALGIAGQGTASPASLLAALAMAGAMATHSGTAASGLPDIAGHG
ncbi:4-hydroxythreonine-4-phosphate dehydrogenase PdxA [Pelagibius litoralis]|uniref:4-hydroxythreonine-4-phosphate dehydrogenase n=1 Tax=Pelagibius litoralis TaxID=374515 RepID=A0A967EZJ3_9PROT|nr:4-hydroxythreonine-4-phosphate dehydrogenase PdxA [Pelagibius litoralis]NIA70296.1 4-hydroxythreonine-4-phosphate dehydrogenase PdxA [Pelagibius litoralis]